MNPTPSTQTRPRPSRLDSYRPVTLTPQNWAVLLKDDHPLGGILDFRRG